MVVELAVVLVVVVVVGVVWVVVVAVWAKEMTLEIAASSAMAKTFFILVSKWFRSAQCQYRTVSARQSC